jgi:endonuclease/exonuclease/phosphatase family metal-dependent hydrolase
MRVATYNVHDGVGRDGCFGPGRIAQALVEIEVDVIVLRVGTLNKVRESDRVPPM